MSEGDEDERDDGHLEGVSAGAGCTEVWEYLSEQRERARRRATADESGDSDAEE